MRCQPCHPQPTGYLGSQGTRARALSQSVAIGFDEDLVELQRGPAEDWRQTVPVDDIASWLAEADKTCADFHY